MTPEELLNNPLVVLLAPTSVILVLVVLYLLGVGD